MISYDNPNVCPHCLAQHELTSPLIGGGKPQDGDVSICVTCAGCAVWENGMLVLPSEELALMIAEDPRILFARASLMLVKSRAEK